ncbi:MAG TPA: DEAD/DEAH box helicase, partial [Candidatus Didemnitutus sp.]
MNPAVPQQVSRRKITGVCPAARAFAVARLVLGQPAPVCVAVIDDPRDIESLAEDIALFLASPPVGAARRVEPEVLAYPESQADQRDMREAFNAASDRLTVLSKLRARRGLAAGSGWADPLIIVTTPAALMQPVPPIEDFSTREVSLVRGENRAFQSVPELLRSFDYDGEAVCEAPGQYSVRGGIIDVYPITAAQPYRLDFFGDRIEDIKALDPVSQRSGDSVEQIVLTAAPRVHTAGASASFASYLNPESLAVLVEPKALEELFDSLAPEDPVLTLDSLAAACVRCVGIADLDLASALFDGTAEEETWDTESLSHHRSNPEIGLLAHERLQAEDEARRQFLLQIADWRRDGFAVDFFITKDGEEQRIRELLGEDTRLREIRPRFVRGAINEGFRVTDRSDRGPTGYVAVTETEIFGRKRQRRVGGRRIVVTPSAVDQLLDFSELVEGDFVVHLQHGVAVYRGLSRLEMGDGTREVISLEFADKVTLHVPLQESHLISRYVGLAKAKPLLGRVGSGRWEKVRAAAERATLDLAAELLEIQARREAQPGHAFPPDNTWQQEFEAAFPFTETRDQLKAINEAKADMEKTRPMDRLVCGDVGFGKTEVAIRAAFKSVMGGRQVAVLVPTTVLAQQHLNTFRDRMAGYPVAVEMISRFRSRKEQQQILAATAAGKVDILIGTHRLVQEDVRFHELGLVVIDEEQRFGVKHKEVFKRWRATVDMLSMSATPIPRTLYLALTGARDLSNLETPPANRLPIQTVVKT